MRISGFTIARQAIALGYPLGESIRSLLPLVDEYVVGIGDGDDGTWELVERIADPRIKPFRSTWDLSLRQGGLVLSEETNKALSRCTGDWAIYLQADEVLHEDELPGLRAELERHRAGRVEGLSFLYYHFYGSFDTIQDEPGRWYRRATRAVKTGVGVHSIGDACAFAVRDAGRIRPPRRADVGIHVYHYGWARPPGVMAKKSEGFDRLYHDDEWLAANRTHADPAGEIYAERKNLRRFTGTHPGVMQERVAAQSWSFDPKLEEQRPDWIRRSRVYGAWLLGHARKRLRRWLSPGSS